MSPQLRRVTIMTWALWLSAIFCTYAFFIWIPGLLVERGMTITQSFSISIWIYVAQIPGYFSAALAGIGLAIALTDVQIIAMSIALSFFINGVNTAEYAYTPEVFPTRVRATGVGLASAIGRIGALAVLILGVPTKGRSLEEIEALEFSSSKAGETVNREAV